VKVERTIDIAAPPERVYDLVMDPRRLEQWVTIHDLLEQAPDGQLEQGLTLVQRLKLAGRRFTVRWTVVENEQCRRVVWEGDGPVASHARVVYEFEPNSEGTRFSYLNEYRLPGGPFGRLAGSALSRVTAKELDGSLARLKRIVESEPGPQR
jgi:carbon monoxide dehydrogenase subunit G